MGKTVLQNWGENEHKIGQSYKHIFKISQKSEADLFVEIKGCESNFIFGRDCDMCDYVIDNAIVSRKHLKVSVHNDNIKVTQLNATNKTYLNHLIMNSMVEYSMKHGDTINIDNNSLSHEKGIIFEYYKVNSKQTLRHHEYDFTDKELISVGRDVTNDISINHPMISFKQFTIKTISGEVYLEDMKSLNGTYVNGVKVKGIVKLNNNDSIFSVNTKFILKKEHGLVKLQYTILSDGISLKACDLVKKGRNRITKREEIYLNRVSVEIEACEFVAIVGGSGAGKSTLMDCLNRFRPANTGKVYINSDDFEANYQQYRNLIGYVQQKDALYEELTVGELLKYSAKLRMPKDTTRSEIEKQINIVL